MFDLSSYTPRQLIDTIPAEPIPIVERVLAEKSLKHFVMQAWHIVEPKTPLVWNWHLDIIVKHLEAITNTYLIKSGIGGTTSDDNYYYETDFNLPFINYFLCNIPPRHSKSLIAFVFWPCWEWGPRNLPALRYIFTSYSQALSTRDSLKRRRIIESNWYKEKWGNRFSITTDQNQKTRFDNDRTGFMLSTSLLGMVTGEGGDRVCLPYNQKIDTEIGRVEIGKIVEEKLEIKAVSFNHKTNEIELSKIEKYFENEGREILEIELEDGTTFQCTEDHPVYVNGKGYIQARELTEDIVFCLSSKSKKIKSIHRIGQADKVYNLQVAGNRNYFANGILIHNCADDPNSTIEMESEVKCQRAIDVWDDTYSTRVNDDSVGAYIVVQQRTGTKDISGHLLKKYENKELSQLVHVCLPARYEKDHPHKTRTPLDLEDPRTVEGELLDKIRWSDEKLKIREGKMTAWAKAGQLQQRPRPKGGLLVQAGKIKIVENYNHRLIKKMVRYWDKAACLLAGTMITTLRGYIPIEDVVVGDYVLTRNGYRIVEKSFVSGYVQQIVTVLFSDGRTLSGTHDHPVFTKNRG